jgi:hypothetical protein
MSSDARRKPEDDSTDDEPPEKKAKEEIEDTSINSQDEVLAVLAQESAAKDLIILDVRTDDEILQDGFLQTSRPGHRWLHVSCQRDQAPLLERTAPYMIPNKESKWMAGCGKVLFFSLSVWTRFLTCCI